MRSDWQLSTKCKGDCEIMGSRKIIKQVQGNNWMHLLLRGEPRPPPWNFRQAVRALNIVSVVPNDY